MKDTIRKTVELPRFLWERISDYRHANKLRSEREAVQNLIEGGLDHPASPKRKAARVAKETT